MSILLNWNGRITLATVRIKAIAITTAFPLEEGSPSMPYGRIRTRILLLRRSRGTSRSIRTGSMRSQSNFQRPVSYPKAARRCLGTSLGGNLEYCLLAAAAFYSCSHGQIGIAEQRLPPVIKTTCRVLGSNGTEK